MADRKFFVSKDELQSMYDRGLTMLEISKLVDVSKKTIMNWMNKFEISRRQRDTQELTKEIKFLASENMTSKEIAYITEKSLTVVNRHIRKHNIDIVRYHKGFTKSKSGYVFVYVPTHANANKRGYVREHIFIMTEHIGRPLEKGEVVHHIDEVKDNNNLSNLKLMSAHEHKQYHSQKPRKNVRFELL